MQRAYREDCARLRLEREGKDRRQEAGLILLEAAKVLLDAAADEEGMARHVIAAARRITCLLYTSEAETVQLPEETSSI